MDCTNGLGTGGPYARRAEAVMRASPAPGVLKRRISRKRISQEDRGRVTRLAQARSSILQRSIRCRLLQFTERSRLVGHSSGRRRALPVFIVMRLFVSTEGSFQRMASQQMTGRERRPCLLPGYEKFPSATQYISEGISRKTSDFGGQSGARLFKPELAFQTSPTVSYAIGFPRIRC